jgi:Domain of unknown function (DUF4402)
MVINRFCRLAALGVVFFAAPACAEECRLCETAPTQEQAETGQANKNREVSLRVDILSGLNFNRAAHIGKNGGQISVNSNGSSDVRGGLADLGGYAVAGNAMLQGEPGRQVRIDLPHQVEMRTASGDTITIVNLTTNLAHFPRLDASGQLAFSFGGDLIVLGDMSGKFHGRIPITAQYE